MLRIICIISFFIITLSSCGQSEPDGSSEAYEAGDYDVAYERLLPLAQGYAPAQYNLGVMYHEGSGVPQDDTEAVKWYRTAAEQGYALAQHNLGLMYQMGLGVPQVLCSGLCLVLTCC